MGKMSIKRFYDIAVFRPK